MTANFHVPIINGDPRKNDAAIWNDPYGTLDAELSDNSSELEDARGAYPSIGARFDSLVLSGGNVATLVNGAAAAAQKVVNVDSATGFIVGCRVGYTLVSGQLEYNTIATIDSPTRFTLNTNINPSSSGIPDNALITMISESEYQAAHAVYSGGTASATLPSAVEWLEREINVKAFGAIGNAVSHLVGSGSALTATQAMYPLTQAAFGIAAADEIDWCAIQEAVLTAGQVADVGVENVYIPAGSYKVNRTITVPLVGTSGRSMTITGGGYRGTTAGTIITATANISIFLIPGLTTIRQLHLFGNDSTNASSIGIRIGGLTGVGDPWTHNNCLHVTIDRVYFNLGFYRCISALYEVDQLKITHCTSTGALGQAVVYLSNDHATNGISPSAGVVIESCAFANNASVTGGDSLYGVYLMGTEGSTIRNCVIRGYDNIFYLTGTTGVRNDGVLIEGIHSEINQPLKVGYLGNRWTPGTAYTSGTFIRPAQAGSNGWWYKCTTSGTSNNTLVAAGCASIRTTAYRWTASARGTGEFYLELAAGGDPSIAQPFGVMENGAPIPFTWAGNLAVSQWGYGNNDSLGFNTIYIRLSDSTDPDTKATHYVWTTGNEPVWPTTYGGTVTDGTVVWTAFKQAIFCHIAAPVGSVNGGLRINSIWCEMFSSFIHNAQAAASFVTRVYVNGVTVRSADMVYNARVNFAHALQIENSLIDGCIKPFSALNATNAQTSVMLRFCSLTNDYTGALGTSSRGVSTWFTNEPSYTYDSEAVPNDVDFTLDPRQHSQITCSTGSSGTAIKVYVPYLSSSAFYNGLKGKTITITHGAGSDGLTVEFNANQTIVTDNGAFTSISLPNLSASVTIRLAVVAGNIRWVVVGSHKWPTAPLTSSFQPEIKGSGTDPTINYTSQQCNYVVAFGICFYNIFLTVGGTFSGGTGNMLMTLPLTASSATQPRVMAAVAGYDMSGVPIDFNFQPTSSSATGAFFATVDNGAIVVQPLSGLAAGDSIIVSGFYYV